MTTCTTGCSGSNDITMFQGRHYTVGFTLTTSNPAPSTPMDLTGASIWLSVKSNSSDTDEDAVISKANTAAGGGDTEIKVLEASSGTLEVYFVPGDTSVLSAGEYWYDLVVENSSGRVIQVVAPSKLKVMYTITKFDA